jgi:mRNA interferase RelE/StbE
MTEPGGWKLIIHRKAEKALKRLNGSTLDRLRLAIRELKNDPRPQGYKKIVGYDNLYRIRVGEWRIIYAIEDDQLIILVLEVGLRGSIYRELK